jgi:uroporphyrinogen-III decarboxylase
MCLFGNVQMKLFETGTEADVTAAVKRCMDEAKEGGGYVIMPTAAPMNSPLSPVAERNMIRFIDAALEYGQY